MAEVYRQVPEENSLKCRASLSPRFSRTQRTTGHTSDGPGGEGARGEECADRLAITM